MIPLPLLLAEETSLETLPLFTTFVLFKRTLFIIRTIANFLKFFQVHSLEGMKVEAHVRP